MSALFDFAGKGDSGLYLWTAILIAIIMAIAIPLTIYEQKVASRRAAERGSFAACWESSRRYSCSVAGLPAAASYAQRSAYLA